MHIALVSPLFEAVPPATYGGTERVVAVLANALTWHGIDVTVFASAESKVDAELVACRDHCLSSSAVAGDNSEAADHIMEFDTVRRQMRRFDLVHFHTRFVHFPLFEQVADRTVTTCHNRVDFETLPRFFDRFGNFPLISISDAQRKLLPDANWVSTIYHGYPLDRYSRIPGLAGSGDYLAFLGRMSPEKGVLQAIEIAKRTGRRLKIAARINAADRDYWQSCIKPLVDGTQIEFVGEVDETGKTVFLNRASALLFPIQWPEPFGLVMIEAMACGVPVIAFDRGSAREVIDDGKTGFVVDGVDDAVAALERAEALDRAGIRATFERRFSDDRMAREHIELYERLIDRARARDRHRKTNQGIGGELRPVAGRVSAPCVPRPVGASQRSKLTEEAEVPELQQ